MTRTLIVNADDFGRSPAVNRGIARAHEHGIVTSATLMVRWPDAAAAAAYARTTASLSVGLHVDLAEWIYCDDEWRPTYQVVDPHDERAVRAEIDAQVEQFVELVGRPPSHLDSHQHVHREEPVRSALRDCGEQLGVPVRDVSPGITYAGAFYGQDARGHPVPGAITVDHLVALIEDLPDGVTELGCHPADDVDFETVYGVERRRELDALCDPRVRAAIAANGVSLRSFGELAPR